MHNSYSSSAGFQVNTTQAMTGGVLVGTGAVICMAGMIVGGSAVCSATRKWFRAQAVQSPQPVKTKWAKRPKVDMAGSMSGNGVPAHSGQA